MSKTNVFIFVVIAVSFGLGFYFYPQMPSYMASHWGIDGQVNGFISKFWGLFLVPIMTLALWLLFLAIPKIDPLKSNIAKFRNYFDGFVALIVLFLFYIHLLTLAWNLGYQFNMSQFLAPAFAVLLYCAGVLIQHAKPNWFIGTRTPWTLSSEVVWDKTHRIGGKLFKAAGILALGGLFFPGLTFYFVILPILVVAIFTLVYSYLVYRKEAK